MATDLTSQPNPGPGAIDVRGLSPDAVHVVESLVGLLRAGGGLPSPDPVEPDEWVSRWRAWTAGRPTSELFVDDSRASIYDGCGE